VGKPPRQFRGSKQGPLFSEDAGPTNIENFFHCNEKGPKTRLYGAPLFAHNKSIGFRLTSSCGQTTLAIAHLKDKPSAQCPRPEVD